jgi:hypothetical protein
MATSTPGVRPFVLLHLGPFETNPEGELEAAGIPLGPRFHSHRSMLRFLSERPAVAGLILHADGRHRAVTPILKLLLRRGCRMPTVVVAGRLPARHVLVWGTLRVTAVLRNVAPRPLLAALERMRRLHPEGLIVPADDVGEDALPGRQWAQGDS